MSLEIPDAADFATSSARSFPMMSSISITACIFFATFITLITRKGENKR